MFVNAALIAKWAATRKRAKVDQSDQPNIFLSSPCRSFGAISPKPLILGPNSGSERRLLRQARYNEVACDTTLDPSRLGRVIVRKGSAWSAVTAGRPVQLFSFRTTLRFDELFDLRAVFGHGEY